MEDVKKGWLYTLLIYIIVSLIVAVVIGSTSFMGFAYNLALIMGTGFVVAIFTVYVLTPLAFWKKLRPLSSFPADLQNKIDGLIQKAGIKRVKFFVYDSPEFNAFTYFTLTGPRIVTTSGLLDAYNSGKISLDEFAAIIGHEIGHIKHYDPLRGGIAMSWVSILNGFGTFLIFFGLFLIGLSAISGLIRLINILIGAISLVVGFVFKVISKLISIISLHHSRMMEYQADSFGATLTSNVSMAEALKKIESYNATLQYQKLGYSPYPEGWQVPPIKQTWVDRLFSTHPPTEKRIERLLGNQ